MYRLALGLVTLGYDWLISTDLGSRKRIKLAGTLDSVNIFVVNPLTRLNKTLTASG